MAMKFDLKIGAVTSPNELQLVFREDFMKRILGVNYDAFGDCIVRTQGGESFEAKEFEKIIFSGGKIGYQVELSLEKLKEVIEFELKDISM